MDRDSFIRKLNNGFSKRDIAEFVKQDDWRVYDTAIPLQWQRSTDIILNSCGLPEIKAHQYVWVYYKDGRSGPVNIVHRLGEMLVQGDVFNEEDCLQIMAGLELLYEDMKADAQCADMKNELPW